MQLNLEKIVWFNKPKKQEYDLEQVLALYKPISDKLFFKLEKLHLKKTDGKLLLLQFAKP